jgi:hypothetical protein
MVWLCEEFGVKLDGNWTDESEFWMILDEFGKFCLFGIFVKVFEFFF